MEMNTIPNVSFILFLLFFLLQFQLEVKFPTAGSDSDHTNGIENLNPMLRMSRAPYFNSCVFDNSIPIEKGISYFQAIHSDFHIRFNAIKRICAALPGDTFVEDEVLRTGTSQVSSPVGKQICPRCSAFTKNLTGTLKPNKNGFTQFVEVHKHPNGFRFAFSSNSSLVSLISRTILNVMGRKDTSEVEISRLAKETTKTEKTCATGFSIDVFHRCFKVNENGERVGTYNDLVKNIIEVSLDAAVGDITIRAERASRTSLSIGHYALAGDITKHDKRKDVWLFLKPLSWDLWLASFMALFFVGVLIGTIEMRSNVTNPDFSGPLLEQLGMMIWYPISMLVLQERRMAVNKWSKFVFWVWVVLSFIVFQCYTAKLISMLTVDDEPQPFFNELERPYIAGYSKDFLVEQLKFSESHLKAYSTIDEYHRTNGFGFKISGFDEHPSISSRLQAVSRASESYSDLDQIPDGAQLRVFMVVQIKDFKAKNMWIFMEPFSLELWLTILMACIFVGISIGILELRANDSNPELEGSLCQQLSIMLWIPISMVVLQERRMVVNKWSKFVLLVWLVLSFIVFQCYTAKLTTMLTVDEPQPSLNELERPHIAGYHKGSSVKDFLVKNLKFSESNLKPYSTIDEYQEALSKGSHNGGVDAVFDEPPNVKLFLHKYGSKYTVVGPIDKTSESDEKKYGYDELASISPQSPSLKARSFGGLFIITGAATIFALVCSEISRRFCRKVPSSRLESRVHSSVEMSVTGDSPVTDNQEHPPTTSNQSDWNVSIEDDDEEEEVEEVVYSS